MDVWQDTGKKISRYRGDSNDQFAGWCTLIINLTTLETTIEKWGNIFRFMT